MNNGLIPKLKNICPEFDQKLFSKSINEVTETLAMEYSRIFIGPGKHISPYESVHVKDENGRTGLLWGESAVDFKAWVEHYGLKIGERFGSIPDHFCTILEFMANIVGEEERFLNESNEKIIALCRKVEVEFFNKHIGNWMAELFNEVADFSTESFYKEMSKLACEFIGTEKELVKVYQEQLRSFDANKYGHR